MTEKLDLEAIERRCKTATSTYSMTHEMMETAISYAYSDDIPTLIARVRELEPIEAEAFKKCMDAGRRIAELERMVIDHVEANEVCRDLLTRALPCVSGLQFVRPDDAQLLKEIKEALK